MIIHGDAAVALQSLPSGSVDMIYSDPPFGTEQVWTGPSGTFDDRWSDSAASQAGWVALSRLSPTGAALMRSIPSVHLQSEVRAYLGVIAGILIECRRVLRLNGTLWLHFDDTRGAELRLLCDAIFGFQNALGTIIWKRTTAHGNRTAAFGRVHDTIAVYGRSRAARWKLWRLRTARGDPLDAHNPVSVSDMLTADALRLNATASERVGYPTQKPVSLLTHLIGVGTARGDTVLDPTMGSGTTLVAARRLGRSAIGIDASEAAVQTARRRLAADASRQTDLFEAA